MIEQRIVRILLVEDNPADVELLRMALKHAKLECELMVVEDGGEAMALIRQRDREPDGPSTDLIVLDLNLPKSGGLEVLSMLRASPAFARTPVAILSSTSSPRERAKIEEFQVEQFITKPLDLDEFLRIGWILKALVDDTRSGRESSAT